MPEYPPFVANPVERKVADRHYPLIVNNGRTNVSHPAPLPFQACSLAAACCAALLAGCGAGAGTGTPVQAVDAAAYASTLDYCGIKEPSGTAAQPGWSLAGATAHLGAPTYDIQTIVSVTGSMESVPIPVQMQIASRDYRGVTGSLVLPGIVEPNRSMGVVFSGLLPPKSAACVVSLAKLTPLSGASNVGRYALNWSSKWAANVSFAGVPGAVIDGFEFASTFASADGKAFFFLPKSRIPSTQGVSMCYLAAAGGSWDCSGSSVSDAGSYWSVERTGARAGLYVIAAPSAG